MVVLVPSVSLQIGNHFLALFPDDEEEAERVEQMVGEEDDVDPYYKPSLRGASFLQRLQLLREKVAGALFKTSRPFPAGGWIRPPSLARRPKA